MSAGMPWVDRVDAAVGNMIDAGVRGKHTWRLRRLGHAHVLQPAGDALWAGGEPAPRGGCTLEVLIDGEEAMAAIAAAIGQASRSVHIMGWHIAPHFELVRGESPVVLGALLAEVAERVEVRVLVWAGAPVPVFHPTRAEVAADVECLTRQTRIVCQTDPREHPFHCHHEKAVIVDGQTAFVGGIDMTDFGGDRNDARSHPARRRLGWHDVATRLRGPAVGDVAAHFAMRWAEVTGEELALQPEIAPCGDHTVQVVRTVADGMYERLPDGEFRILESYVRALRAARQYIYLENQFLWAPEIVELLAEKLRRPPADEFRLLLVLPARANNGHDDTRGQLGRLVDADGGNSRLLAATLRSLSGEREDPLYVHAKVGIVDDRWLTVGSANLNAHSLLNDTEMNVCTDSPELARDTRVRLWAEHLDLDPGVIAGESPHEVIDGRFRPIASDQLERQRTGRPPSHHLLALPGVSRRSRRLLGPLEGLFDDG